MAQYIKAERYTKHNADQRLKQLGAVKTSKPNVFMIPNLDMSVAVVSVGGGAVELRYFSLGCGECE